MTVASSIRELRNGDRMTRAEFHRVYKQTPERFRAELIGGIVYCGGRVNIPHGSMTLSLCGLCGIYKHGTSGVEAGVHATILLGELSEPEPDLFMRLLPEYGGQSRTTPDDFLEGPPELLIEVAYGYHSIDLHAKKDDYARYGVREYVVPCLAERHLRWFDLAHDRELHADEDSIARITTFPGLWIDVDALFAEDGRRHVRGARTRPQIKRTR